MFGKIKHKIKQVSESVFSYFADWFYQDDSFGSEWIPLGGGTARQIEEILFQNLESIRYLSRQLWYDNEHYKGIIRTYVKYIAGKVITVEFHDDERANEAWKNFVKHIQFRRLMKEWVRRFFRDGETFLYLPTMKFIDPALIVQPNDNPGATYGIEQDEQGNEIAFYVSNEQGTIYRIDGSLILHTDDTDCDQKRGIPYLLTLSKRSRQYNDLLEARVKLNEIRASIALIRKHEGASPTGVKTFADAKKDDTLEDRHGKNQRQAYIRPGSVIDTTNRTTYEYLAPNIQASDVQADIRSVRLCFSAMTGLPEFMITGDASNGNYASTMIAEGPGVREIEDWQDFFAEEIFILWKYVTGSEENPEVRFPPIISRKTKEETERNKTLFDAGIISKEEWRRREGVDSDQMEEEINGAEETNPNNTAGEDDWQQDFAGKSVLPTNGKQDDKEPAKEPATANK